MLEAFDVYHTNGRVELHRDELPSVAWLPKSSMVEVVIARKDSRKVVYRHTMSQQRSFGVFTTLSAYQAKEFFLTEEGDYVVGFLADGKPMTSFAFSVFARDNGDQFDPKKFYYTRGPWDDWAFLHMPLKRGDPAAFRCWRRGDFSFVDGGEAVKYTAEIRKDGDVIADGGSNHTGTQKWQKMLFDMKYPQDKGGVYMTAPQLFERGDGIYHTVLKKDDRMFAVWQFEVKNGKPLVHARQSSAYQPRTEYMVPRNPSTSDGGDGAGDIIWMKRLPEKKAQAIYQNKAADVAGPSDDQRRSWQWRPSADPKRPFSLVVTDVPDTKRHDVARR